MLKELFSALRGEDQVERAFSEFAKMLEHAEWMFHRANDVIQLETPPEDVRDAIYSRDQSINELLRSIRRRIVRHLTINPGMDVPSCLALMSVAKDAERIGDYCKNVFEVGRFYHEEFHVPKYHEPIEQVRGEVDNLFMMVRNAWRDMDDRQAKDAIKAADRIGARCDEIIEGLLGDHSSMHTQEAVAYSLLARHYKRVSSHLSNVCTAILGRIEELDFRLR